MFDRMKWTEIIPIIEAREQPKFPILFCYEQFFRSKQTPQQITYDKLMKENFENTLEREDASFFEDTVGQCGPDALAYYRSLHRSQHDWGIYIIDAGVDFVAKKIRELATKDNISLSRLDAEYLAKHKLLLHELGHHATEIVHSVLETDSNNPRLNSYRKYIAGKNSAKNPSASKSLHDNEEAVCNWNVKKKKRHFKIRAQNYYSIARNFMLNYQPDGYKHFEKIAPRNYLKNIMMPDPRLPQKTKSRLKKQFTVHSRLNMVKPFTKKKEEKAFQVPIYLIRTGKQLKK